MQTPQNQFFNEIKCKFLNKQEICKQLIMNFTTRPSKPE